jgi:hypothetical protein
MTLHILQASPATASIQLHFVGVALAEPFYGTGVAEMVHMVAAMPRE